LKYALRDVLLATLIALAPLPTRADEQSRREDGKLPTHRVISAAEESAQPLAFEILRLLAAGDIEAAARLSNEPARRREVLTDYQARVGDTEFRRVFEEYLSPRNRVVAELAIGAHRLIIWDLADAGHRMAGQYYVLADGRFFMDDRPSAERTALQRVLEQHRRNKRR
jgi:hypothetical protein